GDRGSRLPGAAGDVRHLRLGNGAGQPRRRHHVLVHRPEGTENMSTDAKAATLRNARAIRMQRWRRSLGTIWKDFSSQRSGVVGLIGLVVFLGIAIITPLATSAEALSVTQATGARMAPPTSEYWLGTDEFGRSVLLLT